MFVLRTIHKDGQSFNQEIEGGYSRIDRSLSPGVFAETFSEVFGHGVGEKDGDDEVYGFIVDGSRMPLYRENRYYVMNDEGGTFESIYPH